MSTEPSTGPRPAVRLSAIVARLDRWRMVPTEIVDAIVSRDGGCSRTVGGPPWWPSGPVTDRELAARTCAGCGQLDACLELELRTTGADTVGVFGGLSEQDRHALYPLWLADRERDGGGDDD